MRNRGVNQRSDPSTAVSRLNILYLIDSLDLGGAQRQMSYLLAHIDRERVNPTLAVYYDRPHFGAEVEAARVPVILLSRYGGKDPRVPFRLATLLRRGHFDLVHAMLRSPGQLARLAALMQPRTHRTPVVVSERDLYLGRSRPRLWLERLLCRQGHAMIVNGERTRDHVEQQVPGWHGRIHLVRNGIPMTQPGADERRQAERLRAKHAQPGTRLLGIVARIDHDKGPDLVAAALRSLAPDVASRLSVVWMGNQVDPDAAAPLHELARNPGALASFTLAPPRRETRPFMISLDALLLASRAESMPNVVLEGFAVGRPVIASDVGDVARVVVDGYSGWLIPADDIDALARSIHAFVECDPQQLRNMGTKGQRRIAAEHGLEQLCQETLAVYQKATSRRRTSVSST